MRNQTWTQDGTLVQDIEIYRDAKGKAMALDRLLNVVRPATPEEEEGLYAEEHSPEIERAKLIQMWQEAKSKPAGQKTNAMFSVVAKILGLEEN